MKKNVLSLMTILILGSYASFVNAQNDISNLFKAGVVDLNTLAKGYLKPAGNSFSAGLGSNWYNTAEVHKIWGFDLTLGAGVVQAPSSDQTFSLTGLTIFKPTNPNITSATSFTGNGDGVELNLMQPHYLSDGSTVNPLWNNGTGKIITFSTPSRVSQFVPTASIQLTLGVPYVNDVSIRFVPTIKAYGSETSLWGIGIKHNFKQWIPVIKDLPFDAAIVLAYSKFDLKYKLPTSYQITPDQLVSGGVTTAPDPNTSSNDYSTQRLIVSGNAQTVNFVFSKSFLFITPYLGFGMTKTNFDLSMVGNYPTLGDPKTHNFGVFVVPDQNSEGKPIIQVKNITDPVSFKSSETMTNATLGFRLKMSVITLHAQYAFQKYPVASAGLGFTFR